MTQPFSLTTADPERTLEYEFLRATENAALNVLQWLGRGEKELADAAACDAINGVFDLVDIRGEVVIGEGIKDNAPGIFLGDKLGNWKPDAPAFDIALDPVDGTTNLANGPPQKDKPLPQPRRGITHHYCRLGIITVPAGGTIDANAIQDCRCLWPALTTVPRLFYVSGDGQEVMRDLTPGAPLRFRLPHPLIVGVANAHCLDRPFSVRFDVVNTPASPISGWVVKHTEPATAPSVRVPLDAEGLAKCDFHLHGTNVTQQVTARLLDANGDPVSLPLIFNANLSLASEVAYNPASCNALQGRKTVQAAVERLASLARLEAVGGDGQDAEPGGPLGKPIQVLVTRTCGPVDKAVVHFEAEGQGIVAETAARLSPPRTSQHNVTTGADGLTTVFWLPDANTATPTQQLTATLIVPDNSTLKPPGTLRFTANLRVGSHGTCCCLTVGPDGDFRTLAEAFKRLLGKLDDICLCLLPGPHEVNGLEIKPINEKDMVNVHIAGCGAASVIKLTKRPLVAMALNSFVLRNLSLEAVEVASPLRFRDCREVKFQD